MTEPAQLRHDMVERQLRGRGIRDRAVLAAMGAVPREEFVAPNLAAHAYDDGPLDIGHDQTISQPYIVALMAEALGPCPGERVLEVGTGCGYAAAVLGRLVEQVYTIERRRELATEAAHRLARLGARNVHVRCGDGTLGWPEEAPFDAILVSAAGPEVPPALLGQLEVGGRLVMPVDTPRGQRLIRITRLPDGELRREELGPVVFVPLIGAQGYPDPVDRRHAIGKLCVGGDWACAHGDFAALRDIAQRLSEQVSEPLHCELVELARACHGDLDRATAMWANLKDRVYRAA